jgi:hypothetical protein
MAILGGMMMMIKQWIFGRLSRNGLAAQHCDFKTSRLQDLFVGLCC